MGFGSRSSGTQRLGPGLLSHFWQGLRGGVEQAGVLGRRGQAVFLQEARKHMRSSQRPS